jgi:2-polyprenyl-3-methyl-5-hydroxy-6-metoxy-1,4-benzoquinol methylase
MAGVLPNDERVEKESLSSVDRLEQYNAWHERLAETEKPEEVLRDPWYATVARLLPDINGQRVLELGCGRGSFSIWLAGQYPQALITGVDFSEAAIETAARRASATNSTARFKIEDAENLSFADSSYDWVISCECMEHVPHPELMAREMGRVLRPGGQFILTTENYFNGMILQWLKTWATGAPFDSGSGVQPHENFFLFWRVKKILERGGLRVESMESNHYQWLLLPRTNPMKLVTFDFRSRLLKRVFRPFGRHFTFRGVRPA